MKTRLHIVLDEREKERVRMSAERRGQSLSAWLRDAARERLAEEGRPRLDTLRDLRAFVAACDEREKRARAGV